MGRSGRIAGGSTAEATDDEGFDLIDYDDLCCDSFIGSFFTNRDVCVNNTNSISFFYFSNCNISPPPLGKQI
jgi:hypothetical protein